jgi:hypothetical protein
MTWWALDVRTAPASHDAVASWLVTKTGQAWRSGTTAP